jgi:1-acyl-sn-glycerol-3-phosphate acyltransferase
MFSNAVTRNAMDAFRELPGPVKQLMSVGKERLDELKALGDRLFVHLSPADLLTVLFPPALGLDVLYGKLSNEPPQPGGFDPGYPEPELMRAALDVARWFSKHYFRVKVHGVENMPSDTPVLLVGNHSGGLMPLDALFAINEIRDHQGEETVVHPLVHDFAYIAPRVARSARRMGILRADPSSAADALAAGRHVLVYPGGDEDAFRTFADRNRVVLAGRKGFIKLAMASGVPIVPLVSVGLHESFIVLSQGRGIAEKLGLRRFLRTDIFPISLCFPWGIVPAFAPFLPLPTAIEMRFEAPVYVNGDPDNTVAVDAAFENVERTMQSTMDELSKDRIPFVGR